MNELTKQTAVARRDYAAMTSEQSLFAVFCVEAVADELEKTGDEVYRLLAEQSDILDGYIVPYYDVLHTQGKSYIVQDILRVMRQRGIL